MKRFIGAVLCSWLIVASAAAQDSEGGIKDRSEHTRPMGVSAMLYLPWLDGIGVGVVGRFEIPVVHDGFIPAINDQFSIEPSLSFNYRNYGFGLYDLSVYDITPAAYAMWSFHITPKFRPYAAIGLGYNIAIVSSDIDGVDGDDVDASFFYWDTAVGMFYNFSDAFALRAEIGAGGGKVGVSLFL